MLIITVKTVVRCRDHLYLIYKLLERYNIWLQRYGYSKLIVLLWLCSPLRNGNRKPQHQVLISFLPHYVNESNMLLMSIMTALDENMAQT